MSENGVSIELSKAQINRVIREAAQDAAGMADVRMLDQLDVDAFNTRLDDVRFSRSLLRGLMVLAAFPADGSDRAVTDVAKQLGMGICNDASLCRDVCGGRAAGARPGFASVSARGLRMSDVLLQRLRTSKRACLYSCDEEV